MTHYLYPQNLKASANMWFWSLKDFAILGIAALLSIVMLVELRFLLPAAATHCFAFLSMPMRASPARELTNGLSFKR